MKIKWTDLSGSIRDQSSDTQITSPISKSSSVKFEAFRGRFRGILIVKSYLVLIYTD